MPHRKRYLFVCTNRRADDHPKGSCAQRGSEEVAKKLKAGLLARKIAGDFRVCTVSCLDLCEIGVAVVQEPDHVAYGTVTVDDVDRILDAVVEGRVVEDLLAFASQASAGEPAA